MTRQSTKSFTFTTCMLTLGLVAGAVNGDGFTDPSFWEAYDPGANEVGTDPDGYCGAVFDGRYVYFAPNYNGSDYHGEVLRYDTAAGFSDPSAWVTYDPGANGVGTDPDGYCGGVFDGQYVYFAPNQNGPGLTNRHGEVLRFDTLDPDGFTHPESWAAYDPGANGVGTDPDGYIGAVFDEPYVYFAPNHNGTTAHAEVLRYDTTGTFTDPSAWATYDPAGDGVTNELGGYMGVVFGGGYVYFVPQSDFTAAHGEVLRYDTGGGFGDPSSWGAYDPGANGLGTDPDGYQWGVYDGRYVYFAPHHNNTAYHGEVLRYDTTGPFSVLSSWETYDYKTDPQGCAQDPYCTDPVGYSGVVFDGARYLYFVPNMRAGDSHGEVLRYDTVADFSAGTSWQTFDPGANGVGTDPDGYHHGVFDGQYVYFAPDKNGGWASTAHGEVLRYDTRGNYIPAVSEWGMVIMALLVLSAGAVVLSRRRHAAV